MAQEFPFLHYSRIFTKNNIGSEKISGTVKNLFYDDPIGK